MITVKTQYICVTLFFFHNPQSMNQGELKQTLFLNGIRVCYEYDSKKDYMSKRACVLNIIPAVIQVQVITFLLQYKQSTVCTCKIVSCLT